MQKIDMMGRPERDLISTSHIERLNGTTRLHMRRLTRLTYAFSKKLENFEAAVALHFAYYNFVKTHGSIRCIYAWAHETDNADQPRRTVTVLHVPPVLSPELAVRASILQDYRESNEHH